MSDIYRSLIAIDDLAQAHGCGLKPKLRAAIEAELRFRTVSAGPIPTLLEGAPLPQNETRFVPDTSDVRKETG